METEAQPTRLQCRPEDGMARSGTAIDGCRPICHWIDGTFLLLLRPPARSPRNEGSVSAVDAGLSRSSFDRLRARRCQEKDRNTLLLIAFGRRDNSHSLRNESKRKRVVGKSAVGGIGYMATRSPASPRLRLMRIRHLRAFFPREEIVWDKIVSKLLAVFSDISLICFQLRTRRPTAVVTDYT